MILGCCPVRTHPRNEFTPWTPTSTLYWELFLKFLLIKVGMFFHIPNCTPSLLLKKTWGRNSGRDQGEQTMPRKWHSVGGRNNYSRIALLRIAQDLISAYLRRWVSVKNGSLSHTNLWRKIGSRLYKMIRKVSSPVLLTNSPMMSVVPLLLH